MIEREFKQEIKLIKTDLDILKENFKFIWEKNDKCMNENENDLSWEETFAKRYYDKLYKEYCIANLTYYKEGKIGLRWCNEEDILLGKGIKICGNMICNNKELNAYEVMMDYIEQGENKSALVKIYMCSVCGKLLNKMYKYLKKKKKREEKTKKNKKKDKHSKYKKND